MADFLNLSGQAKGLFAPTTSAGTFPQTDTPSVDSGALAETTAGPQHEAFKGEEDASPSFANLVLNEMVSEEAGSKTSKPEVAQQQPVAAVFYSAEPLTESPLGKFQLTMLDGEFLPETGEELPVSGKSLPEYSESSESFGATSLPLPSVKDWQGLTAPDSPPAESSPSESEEAAAATSELAGLTAHNSAHGADTDDVDLQVAAETDSVFDDLAFIKQHTDEASVPAVTPARAKEEQQPTADSDPQVQPAATMEELIQMEPESIDLKSQSNGNSQLPSNEDSATRKSQLVSPEVSSSRRARASESAGVLANAQNQENSRQQFANQLAQSSIVEADVATKTAGESIPQSQSPSQVVSQTASVVEQITATRLESSAATTERSPQTNTDTKAAEVRLAVPFSRKDWNEQLGKQLSFLVSRNMDSAQIQLDPPELGPMQVRISIQQDQVALQFQAQQGVVREALDQSISRLQELFSEEGLDLVSVDVSDGSANKDSSTNKDGGESKSAPESGDESDEILTPISVSANSDGKIDYFI